MRYTVFATNWGWAALAGGDDTVRAVFLPNLPTNLCSLREARKTAEAFFSRYLDSLEYRPNLLKRVRRSIVKYFEGLPIHDWECDVDLSPYSSFTAEVLALARTIPYGQTVTYKELALTLGKPNHYRAVAQALAKNQVPIIVPCHRVVASRGLGGFSSGGGVNMKLRLLSLEKANLLYLKATMRASLQSPSR